MASVGTKGARRTTRVPQPKVTRKEYAMSVADKGKSPDSLPPGWKNKRRFLSAEKKSLVPTSGGAGISAIWVPTRDPCSLSVPAF